MYLTRKHLSRRTVLKAAGISLGLPLLDAMIPAATALAQTAAAPKLRAGFFYLPHGAIMNNTPYGEEVDAWTPTGSGDSYTFKDILQPLTPHKHYVTSFSELENLAGDNSVHSLNPATWLSCVRPNRESAGANMAQTLDQRVAQQIGQETPLPSLELASETTIQVASGGGYYSSTLSYRDAYSPLPMEYNPRKVFINLFGEGDSQEERVALAAQKTSLLDLIGDRTASLQSELGASDKTVLSNYLESVREIERRVEMAGTRDFSNMDLPTAPIGELNDFDAQVTLLFDLIALAFQADLTRVASYFMVSEGTNRTYNHVGVPDSFHPVSHHANDREKIRRLVLIQQYHVQRFADFLGKLAEMPDGEGSVLDNALFLYGSNMSNSDRHNNYPLPIVMVGGAMGQHKGAKHIALPTRSPLANVHLTYLHKLGLPQDSFANSTGVISEA
jgi:hypothetical protein